MFSLLDRKLLFACLVGSLPFVTVAMFTEARGWALLVLIVLGVLTALASNVHNERQPELDDTQQFLQAQLAQLGYEGACTLDSLQQRLTPGSSSDCVNVHFHGTLRFPEPLYQATVAPAEACGALTPRRIAALTKIAEQLRPQLVDLPDAVLPHLPPDPYSRSYIVARTAPGWSLAFSGAARATYSRQLGWSYALTHNPREFELIGRTGRPRSAFPDGIDATTPAGRAWLEATLAAWSNLETEFGCLRLRLDQQRASYGRAVVADFFSACPAGTSFSGTGETLTQSNPPLPFTLDIVSTDPERQRLQLHLRNALHRGHARAFTATAEHDPVTGQVRIVAQTRAADAVPNGGPILSAATRFELEFLWCAAESSRLDGRGADFAFTLRNSALAAFLATHHDERAAEVAREREVWKAITPGTIYQGSFTDKGREQRVSLSFDGSEAGQPVTARVTCDAWSEEFSITRPTAKAEAEHCDLVLEWVHAAVAVAAAAVTEGVMAATDWTPLAVEPWERVWLRLDDNVLSGVAARGKASFPIVLQRG